MASLTVASAPAGPSQVIQAVAILRSACGQADARLDARTPGDGRLHLRLFVGNGLRGSTHLVHQDLEIFTRTTAEVMSEQPAGLSACMDPAVNQIIATLLEMPPHVASLPAPEGSAAGGGYVPPVLPPVAAAAVPPAPAPITISAVTGPASPTPAASVGDAGGPLRLSFTTLELNPEPHSSWSGSVMGTLGVDIRNNTAGMLRVAVIDPWPVVQLEGGLRMGLKAINGIHFNRQANVANCLSHVPQFTAIRPGQSLVTSAVFDIRMAGRDMPNMNSGRLTGELVVYEEASNRCTVEPLAATRINVNLNR